MSDLQSDVQPRIQNPASIFPEAMQGIQLLIASTNQAGLPESTLDLIHLRASQINGCAVCLHSGHLKAQATGLSDKKIAAIATWRDAACFTDAERAALALTEAVTRLSDRHDPVPDTLWNEASQYYDEKQLAGLIISISLVNIFNRFNVSTRQVPGAW